MAFNPDEYLKKKKAPGFDPDAYLSQNAPAPQAEEEPGLLAQAGDAALRGAAYVGEKIDKYTGAPTRAAISSLQDDVTKPGRAVEAFKNQFGEDPKLAPTGRDIVRKAGVPDTALSEVAPSLYSDSGDGWKLKRGGLLDPTASGVTGVAMDVAADPTTLGPGALKLFKLKSPITIGSAAKTVIGAAAKSADSVGSAANAVGHGLGEVGTKVVSKVGGMMTGVPEKEIATYIKEYPAVQKMIAEHGENISGAADKVREGFQSSIRAKRAELGKQVGAALDALPNEKVVDISPVVSELEKVKGRLNQNLRFEEVKQIDDHINRIKAVAGEGGKVTPKEMFDVKEFLQDRGSGAFMKDGQIFIPGKDAQIAAKNASREAREIVNTMSPTVAGANKELSRMHVMESRINKNLIAPGKTDAALTTAGNAMNPKNAKELELLGGMTGTDMVGDAARFAAMKRFAKPGFTAADSTGKAVERGIKSAIVGGALGGPVAAGVATLMTSPMALKIAIQAGRIPVAAVQKLAGATGALTDATIHQAYKVLKTPEGQKAFEAALQGAKVESIEGRAGAGVLRNVADETPSKGEDKWAASGLEKLGIQDRGLASALMQSKEGKRLLIEASDLAPGSKAMQRIKDQIQKVRVQK